MGGQQSSRSTHFHRPSADEDPIADDEDDEHHINISNKMVERLVEDAAISSGTTTAPARTPKDDVKDKILIEKLQCLDDIHSQKWGLTVEDLNAISTRIERRMSNMASLQPICTHCKQSILECYQETSASGDHSKCWDAIEAFNECVRDTAKVRVHERAQRDARDHARRERHVARARVNVLRDLGPGLDRERFEESVPS